MDQMFGPAAGNETTTDLMTFDFPDVGGVEGNHSILSTSVPSKTPIDPALIRFRDESRFWVQRVLMPVVATVGVFGNVATIYVLTRRGMRSSTNAYLTALAIADLLYLLCVFWLSLRHYPFVKETPMLDNFFSYAFPYSLWLTDAATNTSVWLTVTFTVERYIAVCHPIRGRMLCTESRARKVIAAVSLICFTATISTPFEYSVQEVNDTKTNTTKVEIGYSALGEDETYQTVFYWFTSITFVLLPLSLLIIFNSFLIQSVRRSQKLRQAMTQCQTIRSDREERAVSNEIRITITLIAVVMMFLVCQSPTAATLIYKIFNEPEPNTDADTLLRALGNIFNFLVAVNAACNFLLYCALSDKYRRTFVWTFCRCFYRPASPVHSMAFFTTTDQMAGDQTVYSHSRHASVRATIGSGTDRYLPPGAGRGPSSFHGQRGGANGSRANVARKNSAYLALPDGNGSVVCRSGSESRGSTPSRTSFQPNANLRTAVVSNNKAPTGRWTKWWKPWGSSTSSAGSRLSKRPRQAKQNSILIQISDVEDASQQAERSKTERNGTVPDETVAFV